MSSISKRDHLFAFVCSLLAASIGATALAGHAFDDDRYARVFLDGPPLLPDTALGLLAAALALLGGGFRREASARGWGLLAAALVIALGALQIADDLLALFVPYSSFRVRLIADAMGLPAAPQSAFGLTLAGLALLLGALHTRLRPQAEWLGMAVFAGSVVGLAGHLYGAISISMIKGYGALSAAGILGFLLLGCAIPLRVAGPGGIVALIESRTGGGTLLRSIITQGLLLFLIAGWLQLDATTRGWLAPQYGVALFAGLGFSVLFFLMWRTALRINRLEAEKQELGEQYRAILRTAPDAVIVADERGRILLANRKVKYLFGYRRTQLAGRSIRALIPALDLDQVVSAQTLAPDFPSEAAAAPLMARRQDGSEFVCQLSLGVRQTPGGRVIVAIARDVTARYQQERELQRANRALRLISAVTQAARQEHDEVGFARRVCEILVGGGGYVAAWVAHAGALPQCRISAIASAGPNALQGCLENLNASWDDAVQAADYVRTCIRTGRRFVVSDVLADACFAPWLHHARLLGFRSAAAFPVRVDERIEGALMIYASMDYFGQAECELLEDLADDMGYALGAIRAAQSRNAAEAALRRSEANLARAQDIAHLGSWEWDPVDDHMQWSKQTFHLFGLQEMEVVPTLATMAEFCHADDRALLSQTLTHVQRGAVSAASCQFRAVWSGGTVRHLDMQAEVEFHDSGPCRVVGILQDVSERVRFEEELAKLARYDALTGLPNRHMLQDRLQQAVVHARRTGRLLALAFVDLDRFKIVNDTLGHDAGDQLLLETSRRLVAGLREGDTVARLGGDEFVVVLADLARAEDAARVAQKMLDSMQAPVRIRDQDVPVGASMGLALFPRDGATLQELMMNADKAMYSAKHAGRGQYRFYDAQLNRGGDDWLGIHGSLHQALERGEFQLHYQPKLALGGRTTGVEALLRWVTPDQGTVSPAKFIPVLEETGRIVEVGEWVIREACRQVRNWRDEFGVTVPVAVNLSPRQFQQGDLVERVANILSDEGVSPHHLELEITESTVAQDTERAIATMHAFKGLGVRLAIDDFGTGYSSLAVLKRFPADCLKIDRSFVQDLPDDRDSTTITRAIIALAHSMELSVVAEGVETEAQHRFLAECGCDEMQGYLFARPMPAENVIPLLRGRQPLEPLPA